MSSSIRLDRLVGREVYTADNRRFGHIEEFRAERRGSTWIVTGYVIGAAGLLERLGLGVRLILGLKAADGFVARWDQIDLSNPDRPKLTCSIEDLKHV